MRSLPRALTAAVIGRRSSGPSMLAQFIVREAPVGIGHGRPKVGSIRMASWYSWMASQYNPWSHKSFPRNLIYKAEIHDCISSIHFDYPFRVSGFANSPYRYKRGKYQNSPMQVFAVSLPGRPLLVDPVPGS
jgi:hypothetical protein